MPQPPNSDCHDSGKRRPPRTPVYAVSTRQQRYVLLMYRITIICHENGVYLVGVPIQQGQRESSVAVRAMVPAYSAVKHRMDER